MKYEALWCVLTIAFTVAGCGGACRCPEAGKDPRNERTASPRAAEEDSRTEVVLIGGMHEAHVGHPHYSTRDLENIISSLRPSLLLLEIPMEEYENGNYSSEYLAVMDDVNGGTEQHVAWKHCKVHGIECLPFDLEDRQAKRRQTQYWECNEALAKGLERLVEVHPDILQGFYRLYVAEETCTNTEARIANSVVCDEVTKNRVEMMFDIAKNYLAEVDAEHAQCGAVVEDEWNLRNRAMADNICRQAQAHPGGTIVVTVGRVHRYFVKSFLIDSCPSVDVVEFFESEESL